MKNKAHILTLLALATLLMSSCRDVPTLEPARQKGDTLKESMINANKIIAQSEEQQIDAYVSRRGWQMQRLPGGARMMVTRQGKGPLIGYEDTVSLRYSIENMAGNTIYDNVEEQVVAGHMKPVRGLDVALRRLHRGSQARVILPSEQAYGVVGDTDRIGSRMVLVYFLEVK